MRFEDEQYVRLYKRDTTTWLMLNWQGRCILPLIFRKLDRAGLLDLGEDGYDALAAHIQVPIDVVEEGMKSILKRKALFLRDDGLLMAPRFIEAQEAKQSDKARQKASRDRARDLAGAAVKGLLPAGTSAQDAPPPSSRPELVDVTPCDAAVTPRDGDITIRDETVTRGHTASQGVTLSSAQLSSAEPIATHAAGPETRATDRIVDVGGPGAMEAISTYETAVASVTQVDCALENRREHRETICLAINRYSKADSIQPALVWLRTSVREWVTAHRDRAQYTGGWAPKHFVAWLRAGKPSPTSGGGHAPAPPSRARRDLSNFEP